jgi:hypothetical protein
MLSIAASARSRVVTLSSDGGAGLRALADAIALCITCNIFRLLRPEPM